MQPEAQNNHLVEAITSVNAPTPGQGIALQQPEAPQQQEMPIQEHPPSRWPFVLFLVLLVVAVVFGYIFAARQTPILQPSPSPIVIPPFPSIAPRSQTETGSSDAILDIERDLSRLDLSGLDAELPNLEQELQNL